MGKYRIEVMGEWVGAMDWLGRRGGEVVKIAPYVEEEGEIPPLDEDDWDAYDDNDAAWSAAPLPLDESYFLLREGCHFITSDMIPPMDTCPECKLWKMLGVPCRVCPPEGMVPCPYLPRTGQHDHTLKCVACKGTGFVEAL